MITFQLFVPIIPRETFLCSLLPSKVAVHAYSPSSDSSKLLNIRSNPRPSLLCSTYTLENKKSKIECYFINFRVIRILVFSCTIMVKEF